MHARRTASATSRTGVRDPAGRRDATVRRARLSVMTDRTDETRIRRAETRDIPELHRLLRQVADVHHQGRPDLFRADATKYTDDELAGILADETRPVFGMRSCLFISQICNMDGKTSDSSTCFIT